MIPELPDVNENITPKKDFNEFFAKGHELIDSTFSTNQAKNYDPEAKSGNFLDEYAIGILPPPGAFMKSAYKTPRYGCLPPTQVNNVRGWKVGQPVNNKTYFGKTPSWKTVRERHWKNRAEWAKSNPGEYTPNQVERMKKGRAPQRFNAKRKKVESMELHHNPPKREGGLFEFIEVWPGEHAKIDQNRHIGK